MRILILDGHNACWRLMKRLPVLTSKGRPIQVVYGLMRLVRNVVTQFEPDYVVVCWDSGYSEFRKKILPSYKSNRDADEQHVKERESLNKQVHMAKAILRRLSVVQVAYPDTEADDLMALASQTLDGEKIIVSSDQDMVQLVGAETNTKVWSPIKMEMFTVENFEKKLGMTKQQWIEYRAMVGDDGDNIPGVAHGFGPQTALDLIKTYRSVDNLFKPEIEKNVAKKGNRYALLYGEGTRKNIYRNLMLMDLSMIGKLHPDAGKIKTLIHTNMKHRSKVDKGEVKRYFIEQAFASLLSDFGKWITAFESLK